MPSTHCIRRDLGRAAFAGIFLVAVLVASGGWAWQWCARAPVVVAKKSRGDGRAKLIPPSASNLELIPVRVLPAVTTIEERVAADASAAWQWALERLPDDGASWQQVLTQIARQNAAPAANLAMRLAREHPELAQIAWAAVLDPLAQAGDYASAQRVLECVADGEMKNHLVTNLALQWGRDDPLAAASWLAGILTAEKQGAAFAQLGRAWAEIDPAEAAEVFSRLPAGELRHRAMTEALTAWVEKNPAAAGAWLAAREPHEDLDSAAARLARLAEAGGRIEVAFGWADRVIDANQRLQTLDSIVIRWADTDRAAALHYVQNLPALTAAQRATLIQDVDSERSSL